MRSCGSGSAASTKSTPAEGGIVDDGSSSSLGTSAEDELLESTLPDFEGLDFNDADVVADVVERFNKLAARHSHGQHDIKQLPEAMGLPGQLGPKIIQNGKAMHLFSLEIFSDLVAGGKCTTWSPGTAVVTEDGRKGTIVLFDAVGELYSVRLGGGKERAFKPSQLRRAPMPKEAGKKMIDAIRAFEEQSGMATYLTKHYKVLRVPTDQVPQQFRAALHGKELFWTHGHGLTVLNFKARPPSLMQSLSDVRRYSARTGVT